MRFKCRTCGFRSSSEAFFRRERGGPYGWRQVVCDGCEAYRGTEHDRGIVRAVTVNLGISLIIAFRFADMGVDLGAAVLMMALVGFLTLPLRLVVHEFGHAVAAVLSGRQLLAVILGSGPTVRTWRIAGVHVEMRRYLIGGGRTVYLDDARWRRLADAFILLAGPFANFAAAAGSLALCGVFGRLDTLPGLFVPAFFAGLALTQAVTGLSNLLPSKTSEEGAGSDGYQLLSLLRRRPPPDPDMLALIRVNGLIHVERYEEAAREALAKAPDSSFSLLLTCRVVHAISCVSGDRAAVDYYLDNRGEIEARGAGEDEDPELAMAWLKTNVAWCAVQIGDPALQDMADELSAAGLGAFPDFAPVQGTRGAWLVQRGRVDEAVDLLLPAVRHMSDGRDKARFCAFLACAVHGLGDEARAEGFDQLSQHLMREGRRRDRYEA